MSDQSANSDRLLAEIASRQHGVVRIDQLRAAGVDKHGVTHRVRNGRLHRVHRGVYALGHAQLSFEARCLAAAFACMPPVRSGEAFVHPDAAVVSHRSAAAVWDMLPPHSGWIEVTVPTANGRRRRAGINLHRSTASGAGFQTRRHNIPVTTPARTLRDLRRSAPGELVQRAFRRALDLRLAPADVLGADPDLTRSELERLFLALCRRHRLPLPEVNLRIEVPRPDGRLASLEVDFLWPEQRLVVETDGWRHHSSRAAFEDDRERDALLEAAGYRVVRFTYRQIVGEPAVIAAALRALLG